MGGVADEERVALPEAVGELGGEGEVPDPLDRPRGGRRRPHPADEPGQPLGRELGSADAASVVPLDPVEPSRSPPAGRNTPPASGSSTP